MQGDLPSEVEFVLLTLILRERTGLQVADAYKRETGRSMSPGTLYTTFRRLREAGWITVRDAEDEDGRLKFFKITPKGGSAIRSAQARYKQLAAIGRSALGGLS